MLFKGACNENLTVTSSPQNLTSPGYPYDYQPQLNCTWTLEADPGYIINLQFLFLSTDQGSGIITIVG